MTGGTRERTTPGDTPHLLWSSMVAATTTLVPGLLGLLSGQLLLFPSLGPTAVMQAHAPRQPSSQVYNVVVSHVVGMTAAYGSVALFGLLGAPSVFAARSLSTSRVLAAAAAILVGTFIEVALRASHPPAASTTLLVALGSFQAAWRDVSWLIAGVLIVACAGEAARRARIRYGLGT